MVFLEFYFKIVWGLTGIIDKYKELGQQRGNNEIKKNHERLTLIILEEVMSRGCFPLEHTT